MPEIASGSAEHRACRWEQVGSCVYCADHGTRLYVGQIPDDTEAMADALEVIRAAGVRWLESDHNDGTNRAGRGTTSLDEDGPAGVER